MRMLKIILMTITFSLFVLGCQTVKEKTDAIVEKENAKLSMYGQTIYNI